jgi:hypothetical protein
MKEISIYLLIITVMLMNLILWPSCWGFMLLILAPWKADIMVPGQPKHKHLGDPISKEKS